MLNATFRVVDSSCTFSGTSSACFALTREGEREEGEREEEERRREGIEGGKKEGEGKC